MHLIKFLLNPFHVITIENQNKNFDWSGAFILALEIDFEKVSSFSDRKLASH